MFMFLSNEENNTHVIYGKLKKQFESESFHGVDANPTLANAGSREFKVIEVLSKITRGI